MPISVSSQAYVFLWSVIGGIAMAFIYDLFRIKRKTVRTINFLTHIEDLFYWILVALIMFAVVYYSNEGEIRGYIFIGTVLGVILYALVFSRLVMASFLYVLGVIKKFFKATWRIVSFPFKLIFKIFIKPAKFLLKLLKSFIKGAGRTGRRKLSGAIIYGKRIKNIIKKI